MSETKIANYSIIDHEFDVVVVGAGATARACIVALSACSGGLS